MKSQRLRLAQLENQVVFHVGELLEFAGWSEQFEIDSDLLQSIGTCSIIVTIHPKT